VIHYGAQHLQYYELEAFVVMAIVWRRVERVWQAPVEMPRDQ
jgi:hypothetical protein